MSDRFYVSLSATCDEAHLHGVLDRMSAVIPQVADAETGATVLDGLSLSFTRDTGDTFTAEVVSTALPVPPAPIIPAAEVLTAGPDYAGAAPPPAVGDPFPSTAPPTSEPPTPPADADAGLHAAPEEQP